MRLIPFHRKIDVQQNIHEGTEHKLVTKKMPMDELLVQVLIEQSASIARMEQNVQLMAQMLEKFAIASTPAEEEPNG